MTVVASTATLGYRLGGKFALLEARSRNLGTRLERLENFTKTKAARICRGLVRWVTGNSITREELEEIVHLLEKETLT